MPGWPSFKKKPYYEELTAFMATTHDMDTGELLDSAVQEKVAAAIAAEPTVVDAAAAAVDAELATNPAITPLQETGVTGDVLAWGVDGLHRRPNYIANVKLFGAVGDGVADDIDAIDAAIVWARGSGGSAEVYFPGGTYRITRGIRTYQGIQLRGSGPTPGAPPHGVGTKIDASDIVGGNGHAIYTGANVEWDFWHWGSIERMTIEGAPMDGIHIASGAGEAAYIDRVLVGACGRDGIHIASPSTPLLIGKVSVHSNARAGLHLAGQSYTTVSVEYVAGDNNGDSLIWIESLDETGVVNIQNWKSERWNTSGTEQSVVIRITGGNFGKVHLGHGRVHVTATTATADSIIKQEGAPGSNTAMVSWDHIGYNPQSATDSYTYLYNDTVQATTIAAGSAKKGFGAHKIHSSWLSDLTIMTYGSAALPLRIDGAYIGSFNGDPEGYVYGPPGSLVLGRGGYLYLKRTGTGQTGWASAVFKPRPTVANPDTSGATLAELEAEVNELKALLRSVGLIAT